MSEDGGTTTPARLARLPLDQIRVYERNPRHIPNPEYDRIKQSIRQRGLEQPLIVADRADGLGYVVSAGGNTRLAILKELHAEDGDDRFSTVDCVIRPWEGDTAALIAHLRENDLRGALAFIDRARAIVQLHGLLEAQRDAKLTQRQLASWLTEAGYAVSQALISPMVYAIETLEPLVPNALAAGMGRRLVERIRTLERAAATVWKTHRLGSKSEFEETFSTLCCRSDGADWSFEAFRSTVELELATAADARIQTIRLELDQALDSSPRDAPPAMPEQDPTGTRALGSVSKSPELVRPVESTRPETIVSAVNVTEDLGRSERKLNAHEFVADPEQLEDIDALRRQAGLLAHRLAERYGLGSLVVQTPGSGMGFSVADIPDESFCNDLDPELRGRVSLLWWHIIACAESMRAPPKSVLAQLPEHSVLRDVLEARDGQLLFDRVWTPDPGQVGDLLWRALPEPDWQDFLDLMKTYRRLHRVALSSNQSLWEIDETADTEGE